MAEAAGGQLRAVVSPCIAHGLMVCFTHYHASSNEEGGPLLVSVTCRKLEWTIFSLANNWAKVPILV